MPEQTPHRESRRWNWWWCGKGFTVNHKWRYVSYNSKECERYGRRSGGYWTTGIPG